ncbi:MAG: hypothetical protein H7337_24085 [Rhizobacter sp.]|nr:hypothetical protein [Rhizobacter sp.]
MILGVIGHTMRLPLRDDVMLTHGLGCDDAHMAGSVLPTSMACAAVPSADAFRDGQLD